MFLYNKPQGENKKGQKEETIKIKKVEKTFKKSRKRGSMGKYICKNNKNMKEVLFNSGALLGGALLGVVLTLVLGKKTGKADLLKKEQKAEEQISKAKEEAKKIKEENAGYVQKRKENIKHRILKKEERMKNLQRSFASKEDFLNKREERVRSLKKTLSTEEQAVRSTHDRKKKTKEEVLSRLSNKTGQSPEQLKKDILEEYKANLYKDNEEKIIKKEEILKEEAGKTAKKIITGVIQRMCSPTSVETRSVHVKVQKDHIKGKIVGKEGKNIKMLEEALDVYIVFNDLPNIISVSAFQLVNRRTAQRTLEKLIKTRGDITEELIKKSIKLAEEEIDKELYKLGKQASETMLIKNEDKEFLRTVGRLKYRTSYGQNIMLHSMEVGWAAQMLASEIGLDINVARVGGFLHDLGKAIDQDPNVKDAHDQLSKEIMEKHGFSWEETHAAWTHHDAIPQETAEALVVKAADAISASRPGARQESFGKYVERISLIQETAKSFDGVKKAYAISAGREVRVVVDSEKIKDETLRPLAKQLAEKIEEDITYPGKIKVNAIRRTKHTEIAK